jgi:hypothetical protein
VHPGINLLRPLENLVNVQVLLGVIHHLQNNPPLPGQADAPLSQRLLQFSGSFRGIDSLAGGRPVLRPVLRWSSHSFSGCGS